MSNHLVRAGYASRSIVSDDLMLLATCRGRRNGKTRELSGQPIEVNVLACEIAGRCKVTIGLDLAWVDQSFCNELRRLLVARLGDLVAEDIFIAASHTHSAPQVVAGIEHYGDLDADYRRFVFDATIECVAEAAQEMESNQIVGPTVFEHELPMINRKKRALSGKWYSMPNPKRYCPLIGRVAALRAESGETKLILVQLACHPVFEKRNRVSADFPGVMRRCLRKEFGEEVSVLFLQGFSGDIRPDFRSFPVGKELIKQVLRFGWAFRQFTTAIENRMEAFGSELATRVADALRREMDSPRKEREIQPVSKSVSIPVATSGSGRDESIEVRGFNCLPSVRLIGVSGETFAGFGRGFDEAATVEHRETHWPVGLANGLWGYLPDSDLVEAKSGYEYTCWKLFGHDGPLPNYYIEQLADAICEVGGVSRAT